MKGELKYFLKIAGASKLFILLLLLRCPFDYLFTCYNAGIIKNSFLAIENEDLCQLNSIIGKYAIATLLLFTYNGTVWRLFASYMVKIQGRIRYTLFSQISTLSDQKIEQKNTGEWITRMNIDTQAATDFLGGTLNVPHAAVAMFNLVLSSAVLLVNDIHIFLCTLLFIVPHVCFVQKVIAKPMLKLRKCSQNVTAELTGKIEPFIDCADTIPIYDANSFMLNQVTTASIDLRKANMRIHLKNAIGSGFMPLFGMGGYLVILMIGSVLIQNGIENLGWLTSMIQFRGGVISAIFMLTSCWSNMCGNMAGVVRVNEVFQDNT